MSRNTCVLFFNISESRELQMIFKALPIQMRAFMIWLHELTNGVVSGRAPQILLKEKKHKNLLIALYSKHHRHSLMRKI